MRASRKIRARWLLLPACGLLLSAGCGEEHFKNEPRPAASIDLTGVIQPKGVTVSPARVSGGGPVMITISNQTPEAHTVTLEGDSVQESVGPIQPMDTGTIQKTLKTGTYEVRAGSERAVAKEIPAASLRVGSKNRSSANQLLLP
jgi:hypothetical protein